MARSSKKPAPKMPRGTIEERNGSWSLRIQINGERKRIPLGENMTPARAREKADAWLERMAREGYGAAPPTPAGVTVRQHFDAWISGELYRRYGAVNGLRIKKSADVDRWRARRFIYPLIGSKIVADVTEQDIDRVMASVPEDRRPGTRIKFYALLRRGFDLAIMPARLRKDSPVTRYHRPAKGTSKLFSYLFPDELLSVLKCRAVPLGRRVLYALAVYTGLRKSSLYALRWEHIDLDNRMILSTVSKNGLAQLFEIPAGLVWTLRRWHEHCGRPALDAPVVRRLKIERGKGGEAEAFRADLKAAGINRAVLFQDAENIEPIRFHDLRATFVTWAKRAGMGEGWIADRTGHLTPEMIDRYTRAARTLADLRIEPFPELEGSIPELAESDAKAPIELESESDAKAPIEVESDIKALAPRGPKPCPIKHLDVANRGRAAHVTPQNHSNSLHLNAHSGSSGVTPVEVQVLFFAPAEIIEENGDMPQIQGEPKWLPLVVLGPVAVEFVRFLLTLDPVRARTRAPSMREEPERSEREGAPRSPIPAGGSQRGHAAPT